MMSTVTLTPTGGTYITKKNPSTDYSSQSNLLSCSYPEKVDETTSVMDYPLAILRFTRPNAIKYKKITKATLTWETQTEGAPSRPMYHYIAPYKTSAALSGINYNTYKNLGEVGDFVKGTDVVKTASSTSSPTFIDTSESFEVGSIFTNNLDNDVFNIIIGSGRQHAVSGSVEIYTVIPASSVSLVIEYEDSTQEPPTPLYPNGVTVVESGSTVFSWRFNSDTEAVQTSGQIRYKKSTDGSYTTVNVGAEHSYTLNQKLAAGTYQWGVKATNDAGETSAWSADATWNIIGQPAAPIVGDVPNKTLTTIQWSSADQFACEIQLLDSNGNILAHETLATSEAFYKPNMFLSGSYTFMVRIKNSADMWSTWAQKVFTINPAAPTAGTLTATARETDVVLNVTVPADESGAILRDGEVIAVMDPGQTEFIDDTLKPDIAHTYVLRTYVDGYADTNPVTVTIHFGGATLKSDDGALHLTLSEEKFLPYSETMSRDISLLKCSGREFPLTERGEFTTMTFERRFFVTFAEKATLDGICKAKNLYYRDNKGNAFKCAVTQVRYNDFTDIGYAATLSMVRTAEEEVVINV